jgi:uncharacterized protein (DUF1684 family)
LTPPLSTPRRSWVVLTAAVCLAGCLACSSGPPPPPPTQGLPYESEITGFRSEKDQLFRTGDRSPLPEADRAAFPGISYYPIDAAFRVPAFLREEPDGAGQVIALETSKNQYDKMRRVGRLEFSVAGVSLSLTAFAPAEATVITRLFVPFRDLTTGAETYHGGRYLDLDRTPSGLYDLDFNRAYHPYCVYSIEWECPVPPRENRLTIAVRAGERMRQTASR